MLLGRGTASALRAAVALANSPDEVGEPLGSTEDLSTFLTAWFEIGRFDASAQEIRAVRRLRPLLRRLLVAERDEAAEIVNGLLAKSRALPQLQRQPNCGWDLRAVNAHLSVDQRVLVETAMAMAEVIRADEMSRLGCCAAEGCEAIVLDLSRNRSRRYCSTACGNRGAVAAYRARRKA